MGSPPLLNSESALFCFQICGRAVSPVKLKQHVSEALLTCFRIMTKFILILVNFKFFYQKLKVLETNM